MFRRELISQMPQGTSVLARQPTAVLALIGLLIVAAYFSPHIWLHGEAREALVIQDIVQNHNWVLPIRNGELPSKPILYHWLAAAFALLIGVSDFTIRLPSVLGAALMIGSVCFLGRLDGRRNTGILALGILASTFEFWDSGTAARVDMLFAALIVAALAGWYLWYTGSGEWARATAYLSMAFAVLTKGPAGIALPVIVVSAFLLLEGDLKKSVGFFSWGWAAIVVLIDGGWYLAAFYRGGPAFWHRQIVYENIHRFFGTGTFESDRRNFSQAVWLVTQLFPWSLIVLWAAIRRCLGHRQDTLGRFLHAWWLGIFAFFLMAKGQRAVYLLPIYPAVALLAARELLQLLQGDAAALTTRLRRLKLAPAAAAILLLTDLSLAVSIPITRTLREDSNDQEEFVEQVVIKLPPTGVVYAAPEFPETALIVLAYRINRNIPRQTATCDGNYYYLSTSTALPACLSTVTAPLGITRDAGLRLLQVIKASRDPES